MRYSCEFTDGGGAIFLVGCGSRVELDMGPGTKRDRTTVTVLAAAIMVLLIFDFDHSGQLVLARKMRFGGRQTKDSPFNSFHASCLRCRFTFPAMHSDFSDSWSRDHGHGHDHDVASTAAADTPPRPPSTTPTPT
jgi:hypothetical protein